MSDEPRFPTVRSDVLGELAFRPDAMPEGDGEPPWICKLPASLWSRPERGRDQVIEVYLAGDSRSPEPRRLALAERVALDLESIEAACQVALAPHFEDAAQQEFWLMWLAFPIAQPEPRWEAAFTLTSADINLNDTYGLWMVTLSEAEPIAVRRDNW